MLVVLSPLEANGDHVVASQAANSCCTVLVDTNMKPLQIVVTVGRGVGGCSQIMTGSHGTWARVGGSNRSQSQRGVSAVSGRLVPNSKFTYSSRVELQAIFHVIGSSTRESNRVVNGRVLCVCRLQGVGVRVLVGQGKRRQAMLMAARWTLPTPPNQSLELSLAC